MKKHHKFCIFLIFLFTLVVNGQSALTNSTQTIVAPTAKTAVIILKEGHWTIEELNKRALEALWKSGSLPRDATFEARVGIFPNDRTNMCEFTYFRGFERAVWTVTFGYDGKILKTQSRIAKEGP